MEKSSEISIGKIPQSSTPIERTQELIKKLVRVETGAPHQNLPKTSSLKDKEPIFLGRINKMQPPKQQVDTQKFVAKMNAFIEEMKQKRGIVTNMNDIKSLAEAVRNELPKTDTKTLEQFAKELGIDCVLKSSLASSAGGEVRELSDGRTILLYYSLFPWTARYHLAHEIGHVVLGHLGAFEGKRSLKEGIKCEWGAENFASALTRIPLPLAFINSGITGFLTNIVNVWKPFIKKQELEKIMKQLGHDPATEVSLKTIYKT